VWFFDSCCLSECRRVFDHVLKAGKESNWSFVRSLVRWTGHSGDESGSVNVLMILVLRLCLVCLLRCRVEAEAMVEKIGLKSMCVQCGSKDGSCCESTLFMYIHDVCAFPK
jgi:hypothetical protein